MNKLIAVAAAASLSVGALAQFDTPVNLAFRIGYAYPLDSKTRDTVRNFIGVGADYFFGKSLIGQNGETTLSFDWLGKSGSGAKGNAFPIMLNQRWYGPARPGTEQRTYAFLGLGVAIVDVVSTDTVLAARAGYGVELGPKIFAEGTFLFTDDASGARATSVGVYLGYRF
jgi:hypothetical protein